MICSLSGRTAIEPVVSPRSGRVYERKTIEAFIREKGLDPENGEPVSLEELVPLAVDPLPTHTPGLTGIPALLSGLQTEYDAIVLEAYTLRRELAQTKRELSTALYRNDAALRVIARLTEERDEARTALASIDLDLSRKVPRRDVSAKAEPATFVDPEALESITNTCKKLAKERKARNKGAKDVHPTVGSVYEGSQISVHGDDALIRDGTNVSQLNLGTDKMAPLHSGRGALWADTVPVVYTREVLYYGDAEVLNFPSHNWTLQDSKDCIVYHPAGYLLINVGNGIVLWSLAVQKQSGFFAIRCDKFTIHPDGDYLIYTTSGAVVFYALSSQSIVLEFPEPATTCLTASNNGYIVAFSTAGSLFVKDLRDDEPPQRIETTGSLYFNQVGNILAVLSNNAVQFWQYKKKSLTKLESKQLEVADVAWHGNSIIAVSEGAASSSNLSAQG